MKPKSRTVKEFWVSKVEFFMGYNDLADIACGGVPILSFWIYTTLSEVEIQKVGSDRVIQEAVKDHGGIGSFKITKAWSSGYVKTPKEFKKKCLEMAKHF